MVCVGISRIDALTTFSKITFELSFYLNSECYLDSCILSCPTLSPSLSLSLSLSLSFSVISLSVLSHFLSISFSAFISSLFLAQIVQQKVAKKHVQSFLKDVKFIQVYKSIYTCIKMYAIIV